VNKFGAGNFTLTMDRPFDLVIYGATGNEERSSLADNEALRDDLHLDTLRKAVRQR
jgi:hypothetical protein